LLARSRSFTKPSISLTVPSYAVVSITAVRLDGSRHQGPQTQTAPPMRCLLYWSCLPVFSLQFSWTDIYKHIFHHGIPGFNTLWFLSFL
jgi:hypothetical protein